MATLEVPVETVKIALWEGATSQQRYNQGVDAWVVQSKAEIHKRYRIWMKSWLLDHLQKNEPRMLEDVDIVNIKYGGFVKEKALKAISLPIKTCGRALRPKELYRAVHKASANNGVKLGSMDL